MPVSAKKDLYIAHSMTELNEKAELPAKLKTNNAKILVKTADKMLKEAEHSEMLQDEERAYVLFMKYFNVVQFVKKTPDYRKDKVYFDNILGAKNLLACIDKAEALSKSLKERYDLKEAEHVAKKLEALDTKSQETKPTDEKSNDEKMSTTETPAAEEDSKKVPPGQPATPAPGETGYITSTQLFQLMEDRDSQLILMDVRSIEDFQESRLNYKSIINVPSSAIKPGTTVTYIEKAMPMDSQSLWKQRGNIDHIILLDWNSTYSKVVIGSTLQTLCDALFKYDSTVILRSKPLILEGGYEQWMLQYPTMCVNPSFNKLSKPPVDTSQDTLMDFDYPDFEETIMKPSTPSSTDSLSSSSSAQSLSGTGTINRGLTSGGGMPSVDRSTKPVPDRSKKPVNVTTITVNSSKTDSLYPQISVHSKPASSKPFDNTTSGLKLQNDESTRFNGALGDKKVIPETKSDANITKLSEELSDELKELDLEKKRKQEDLRRIQAEYEEIRRESTLRLELLKEEERRLGELETLKKQQQLDVADLLRKKRSIQENVAEESKRIQNEEEHQHLQEIIRKEELNAITKEEEEKRRRQDEVSRLRLDRKRKEAERKKELDEQDERARQQQAVLEARERAQLEEQQKQRDIQAAEDRAQALRREKEREDKEHTDRLAADERLKRERELQAKLDRERQAELEERRRKQAELDKRKQEHREKLRLEREKQERDCLEQERKVREEEDKRKAEAAQKVAMEKLKLQEERSKPKIVPSPNLAVGWEKKLDPKTNRYFYINHEAGTTQWEHPLSPESSTPGSTYTTRLKTEEDTPKRGLTRSNSSPNIAKLVSDEGRIPAPKPVPTIDRANKPIKRPQPVAMPVKRRDLNPVYGNVGRALTGLRNLGNTCYMNSIIQCLNHTSPLITYLLTNTYLYDINREAEYKNHAEVVDDFAYIVKALWSGTYRCISPRDFKMVVGRAMPTFQGYDQQDSQEFLTFLLDCLHEGLNKIKTRPRIPEQDNDNLPTHVAAELAWKNHKLHNESIIVELFQGQLKSTLMCLTCKKQSATYEAFMYLTLPIPSSSRCGLEDCLRLFEAEERMEGSSRWKCTRCKCYRDSVKKIEIWKLPPILLIALKRFVYDGYWKTKINTHIDFPVRGMEIAKYVKGPRPKQYQLYGVSNHFGTLDGGHYTAYCKNPSTRKWCKFDDSEVYEMSESSVKTSAAYVLFYTAIDLRPPEFKPAFT